MFHSKIQFLCINIITFYLWNTNWSWSRNSWSPSAIRIQQIWIWMKYCWETERVTQNLLIISFCVENFQVELIKCGIDFPCNIRSSIRVNPNKSSFYFQCHWSEKISTEFWKRKGTLHFLRGIQLWFICWIKSILLPSDSVQLYCSFGSKWLPKRPFIKQRYLSRIVIAFGKSTTSQMVAFFTVIFSFVDFCFIIWTKDNDNCIILLVRWEYMEVYDNLTIFWIFLY